MTNDHSLTLLQWRNYYALVALFPIPNRSMYWPAHTTHLIHDDDDNDESCHKCCLQVLNLKAWLRSQESDWSSKTKQCLSNSWALTSVLLLLNSCYPCLQLYPLFFSPNFQKSIEGNGCLVSSVVFIHQPLLQIRITYKDFRFRFLIFMLKTICSAFCESCKANRNFACFHHNTSAKG